MRMRGRLAGFGALLMVVTALVVGLLLQVSGVSIGSAAVVASPTAPPNPKVVAAQAATYRPQPSPDRVPAHTAAEFAASLPANPDYQRFAASLTNGPDADKQLAGQTIVMGTPIYVRGLGTGSWNEYVVPLLARGSPVAILVARLDPDGYATVYGMRGWHGPAGGFDRATALGLASAPGDPAVTVELVWASLRGYSSDLQPFWRAVRSSAKEMYIFEDGTVRSALEVPIR